MLDRAAADVGWRLAEPDTHAVVEPLRGSLFRPITQGHSRSCVETGRARRRMPQATDHQPQDESDELPATAPAQSLADRNGAGAAGARSRYRGGSSRGTAQPGCKKRTRLWHAVNVATRPDTACGRSPPPRCVPSQGSGRRVMNPLLVARSQGLFNACGGAWALVHLRSFERFFGPARMKQEQDWLVRTVAGLLVSSGGSQMLSCSTPACLAQARRAGLGTAVTLLTIDLVYVPRGRARRSHMLDAAVQVGWLVAWWKSGHMSKWAHMGGPVSAIPSRTRSARRTPKPAA